MSFLPQIPAPCLDALRRVPAGPLCGPVIVGTILERAEDTEAVNEERNTLAEKLLDREEEEEVAGGGCTFRCPN